jgi:DNA-binding HxlR family transcriptional regulator
MTEAILALSEWGETHADDVSRARKEYALREHVDDVRAEAA